MKQEDKELLLNDLCARLSYGVKVQYQVGSQLPDIKVFNGKQYDELRTGSYLDDWLKCTFKPYLFPLSSMTKEQKREYHQSTSKDIDMLQDVILERINGKDNNDKHAIAYNGIDWLNAHHFDYRGLIEKGLAIDATGLNIY
jgi:hypothetical protein